MTETLQHIRRLITEQAYDEAIRLCKDTKNPYILEAQAIAYSALSNFEKAYELQKKARELNKTNIALRNNLAIYAAQTNRHGEAYDHWIELFKDKEIPLEVRYNLAISAWKTNSLVNAHNHLKKYIDHKKNDPKALRLLASISIASQNLEKALSCYEKVKKIEPLHITDLYQIGLISRDINDLFIAKKSFKEILSIDPNHTESHFEYAQILLREQKYDAGFKELEWRLKRQNAPKWTYFPELEKGEDIRGKTLLVYAEQGAGDTLHFIRYLPLLKSHNIQHHLLCQPTLVSFLKALGFNAIDHTTPPPVCDRQAPLMSLPYRLNTPLCPKQIDIPKELLTTATASGLNLRVGLCWSGSNQFSNNHLRSCGLDHLQGILDAKKTEWTCLIPEISDQDQKKIPKNTIMKFPLKPNSTYNETAKLIKNLDLIITVDTSVAHLAGTLKKETWLILHQPPDWRWFYDTNKSTLYPSIRIYRQKKHGKWSEVLAKLKDDLFQRSKLHNNKQA